MKFRHFSPSEHLRPYIRCYYIFESDSDLGFEDTVFPSSDMEVIFNLGEGKWASAVDDQFLRTPPIELWGQITKPLAIRSTGRHTMLGIRFLTHSAAYFFDEEIGVFNDRVSDLSAIMGRPVKTLHTQLLETTNTDRRLALIETFLLKRLAGNEKKSFRIDKVAHILTSIRDDPSENSISGIACRHNIYPALSA